MTTSWLTVRCITGYIICGEGCCVEVAEQSLAIPIAFCCLTILPRGCGG